MADADAVIVAYGVTARSARHAMRLAREGGRAAGVVRLLTLWPYRKLQRRRQR